MCRLGLGDKIYSVAYKKSLAMECPIKPNKCVHVYFKKLVFVCARLIDKSRDRVCYCKLVVHKMICYMQRNVH